MRITPARTLAVPSHSLLLLLALTACGGGGGGDGTGPGNQAASIDIAAAGTGDLASIGDTRQLTATVRDADDQVLPNAAVTWTTSSAGTVSLPTPASGHTINVTAAGNGTATITATSGSVHEEIAVTVAQRLDQVGVTPDAFAVQLGATMPLTALALDANGNEIGGVTGFAWSTNDASKVSVNPTTGVVTGQALGGAQITATLTRDGLTRSAVSAITVGNYDQTAAVVASETNNVFDPGTVDIRRGGTVTWAFGTLAHNVQFDTDGAPANIGTTTNQQVARTFADPGEYDYHCGIHAGMSGKVLVH